MLTVVWVVLPSSVQVAMGAVAVLLIMFLAVCQ